MSQLIRTLRRPIYRLPRERYSWRIVSRTQARLGLRALEAIYRRALGGS